MKHWLFLFGLLLGLILAAVACDETLPPDPERDARAADAKPSAVMGQGPMTYTTWAVNGKFLGFAGLGGVYLYDLATKTERLALKLNSKIHALEFTTDGTLAVVGVSDAFQIWNLSDGKLLRTIPTDSLNYTIASSPDGQFLASEESFKDISVWRIADATLVKTIKGEFGPIQEGRRGTIMDLAFSPDSKLLAAASDDRTAKIWRVSDFQLLQTLQHPERVTGVAFTPDGASLVSASPASYPTGITSNPSDAVGRIWQIADGKLRSEIAGLRFVSQVIAKPDGTLLLVGSGAGFERTVWELSSDGQAQLLNSLQETLEGFYSADGNLYVQIYGPAYASRGAYRIQVRDAPDGAVLSEVRHMGLVFALDYSPNGKVVAAGGQDYSIWLWRVSDKIPLHELAGHTGNVLAVKYSPDGTRVASGSVDQSIRIWRVSDGTLERKIEGHTGSVLSVAYSPDGLFLASASVDQSVRVWRVSDGTLVRRFQMGDSNASDVAFSPDGNIIAIAVSGWENSVQLWHWNTNDSVQKFSGLDNAESVAVSPDGKLVAGGDARAQIVVWRLADGALLERFQGYGYSPSMNAVTFSADSRYLGMASTESGFGLRVRRLQDGALIFKANYGSSMNDLEISPDGSHLAAAKESAIELWNISQ